MKLLLVDYFMPYLELFFKLVMTNLLLLFKSFFKTVFCILFNSIPLVEHTVYPTKYHFK